MKVKHPKGSDTYTFKLGGGKEVRFLFLISDLSAFVDPLKEPANIRGNYRKCMKVLLGNKFNEFNLVLKSGEYFKIGTPTYSRGRTKKDIEEYRTMIRSDDIKAEPSRFEVAITIPAGNAIKVYSIEEGYETYLVNQGEKFYESKDFIAVEEATGAFF